MTVSSEAGSTVDREGKVMTFKPKAKLRAAVAVLGAALAVPVLAQDTVTGTRGAGAISDEQLAKKLANPVAALISVPFQLNYNQDIGAARGGERWQLNIQPVLPVDLNPEWNLISRTILPVVWQDEIYPDAGSQSGIGDVVQSVFFSPKAPTAGGWIWGAGPVFLLPTGSEDLLSVKKWGAGPTGVALRQDGPWTYGLLANHIWSFAGSGKQDVNATFLQPFVSYTTPTAWSFSLNTESTYDWEREQWAVPINAIVSKVTTVGGQLASFGGGVRYWADGPEGGPHGWGFRLSVTLLFPR
jgi:hypothetical protein